MLTIEIVNPNTPWNHDFVVADFRQDDDMPNVTELEPATEVRCTAQGEDCGLGSIRNAWQGPISMVPAQLLELINEPIQRNFSGLYTSMILSAPGETRDANSMVTLWLMRRIPEAVGRKQDKLVLPGTEEANNILRGPGS
jgi:hypothetical protein